MDVITRIRDNMESRGWTEYRLAKEAGLPQITIANLFRRNTLPSLPTLEAICRAFGMSMSSFFSEHGIDGQTPIPDELWNTLTPSQRMLCIDLMRELCRKE